MEPEFAIAYVSGGRHTADELMLTVRDAVGVKARRLAVDDLEVLLTAEHSSVVHNGIQQGSLAIAFVHDAFGQDSDGLLASSLFSEAMAALEDVGVHAVGMRTVS